MPANAARAAALLPGKSALTLGCNGTDEARRKVLVLGVRTEPCALPRRGRRHSPSLHGSRSTRFRQFDWARKWRNISMATADWKGLRGAETAAKSGDSRKE